MSNTIHKAKVVIIGTLPFSLINFRGELIQSIVDSGHEVVLSAGEISQSQKNQISSLGVKYIEYSIDRHSLSILSNFMLMLKFIRLIRNEKPDIILAYTIKPVIWCGIAKHFFSGIKFYGLITGLGLSFQTGSLKRQLLRYIVIILYRLSLLGASRVIFQNADNLQIFIKERIVPIEKAAIVGGSGVNCQKFYLSKIKKTNITFLCISRLLGEKGVREYAEAARIVKSRFPDSQFNLIGTEEYSFDAIPMKEVFDWAGHINYIEPVNDVRPYIEESHVYVLPSYHEGIPRSTLEAMSMGRPIITTNAPGCRETVKNGINGFLAPIKSIEALVDKMIWFIENSDRIERMGLESRRIVKRKFDVLKVNSDMLNIMEINETNI